MYCCESINCAVPVTNQDLDDVTALCCEPTLRYGLGRRENWVSKVGNLVFLWKRRGDIEKVSLNHEKIKDRS